MSQSQKEILEILEDKNEPLSAKEIAQFIQSKESLNKDFKYIKSVVCKRLRKLLKYDRVSCIEIDRKVARKIYGENICRGLKLYYI